MSTVTSRKKKYSVISHDLIKTGSQGVGRQKREILASQLSYRTLSLKIPWVKTGFSLQSSQKEAADVRHLQ